MITCVVCEKEVPEELEQDFHDNCMNDFIEEMNHLKLNDPKQWKSLKEDFYGKE
jgi:hypothetical protein